MRGRNIVGDRPSLASTRSSIVPARVEIIQIPE
jgi:hypothetical protein